MAARLRQLSIAPPAQHIFTISTGVNDDRFISNGAEQKYLPHGQIESDVLPHC